MIEVIQGQHVVSAALIVILSNGVPVSGYSNIINPPSPSNCQVDHGLSYLTEPYSIIPKSSLFENEEINIMHGFASNLIENIEDLPPEYSEIIDEHFWELI